MRVHQPTTMLSTKTQFTKILLASLFLTVAVSAAAAASPQVLRGQILDSVSRQPVAGAWVSSGLAVTRTDQEGHFELQGHEADLRVRAAGYWRVQQPVCPDMIITLRRLRVRGLYLSFWGVGSDILRNGVLDTISRARLNTVVIDVKGDRSFISFPTQSQLAIAAGANRTITMRKPAVLLEDLHRRGLNVVARIVVFKDDTLARARPDLAVRTSDGKLFVDREGLAWTDPFNRSVWDYNIDIAVEAAKQGFDEIQFDYVRFPDRKGLQFSQPNTESNRRGGIVSFLAEAMKRLTPYNVFVSADNFGYTCWNLDDTGIGQCVSDIGAIVDYISPMLYPSSFHFGIPGVRNPLSDPYRIVYASLQRAKERTGYPSLTFRPWLQAFNDYAFDRRKFGRAELREQIKAAQDAGAEGWLLWDPKNRYQPDVLAELARELW